MGTVYAGTSGWAYPSWKPSFYPEKLNSNKFLGHYASRLNAVEVNYTFRAHPTKKLLRGWIEATPPGFRFAIKAHQRITHVLRLRDAGVAASEFAATLEPLGESGRLGPVLFQLPPYLKCDLQLLEDFLTSLPRPLRAAFEFRHESWFTEEVFAVLRRANVALCQAESESLESPPVETADFSYLRLRKESYSPKALQEIRARVGDLAGRGDVFVFFKHEDTPEGALQAEQLLSTHFAN